MPQKGSAYAEAEPFVVDSRTMNSRISLVAFTIAALILVGCGSKETPADVTSSTAPAASANPAVKNAPDASAGQGAAYRLAPANPNDPKFKPDPKLAGGG